MVSIPGYNEPYPVRDAIVKPSRKPADVLVRWEEQSLLARVDRTPFLVQSEVELTVDASTSLTLGGDQVAGLFRITGYVEVDVADPVSQSLTITIGFTHHGKALTRTAIVFTGTPMTINDNDGFVISIETDEGSSISATLTYVSNTPGLGVFLVSLSSELVNQQE